MNSINHQKDILFLQYSLELFAEKYSSAKKESEKYLCKYMLLEFLTDNKISIEQTLEYMKLQSDKFNDFIILLENTEPEDYTDEDYIDIDDNDNCFDTIVELDESHPLYSKIEQILKGLKNGK